MRIAIVSHPSSLQHDPGIGHPECADRIRALTAALAATPHAAELRHVEPAPATRAQLAAVHSNAHIDRVLAARGKYVRFDPDTATSPGSVDAALYAAGGAVAAVDIARTSPDTCPLVLMRPPGHHAERDRAMGFCLFNNVAVAAMHARAQGIERVLIFDPDVHHGNGTQDIFADDPAVTYVSFHQFPHYPGSGSIAEIGTGAGRGSCINVPLPAGCGDATYAALAVALLPQVFARTQPQLVLVSLGFDAHAADPLGGMHLSASGFVATLAPLLAQARTATVPVAMLLEGGYNLEALAASLTALVAALRDDAFAIAAAPDATATALVERVRAALGGAL